nr:hypothetical protein [uncultured Vibrio sp.]
MADKFSSFDIADIENVKDMVNPRSSDILEIKENNLIVSAVFIPDLGLLLTALTKLSHISCG